MSAYDFGITNLGYRFTMKWLVYVKTKKMFKTE